MTVYELLPAIISSALVLMIFSFLYKHSRWFSLASSIYIGGATGQATAISIRQIYYQGMVPVTKGMYWYILALVLGALLFMRFVSRYSWWVRIPTAILLGTGIGLNMSTGIQAQIIAQISDTMRSIVTPSLITNINNLIIMVGVCCVTMFFFFSREAKGVMLPINKLGRYFLMVALGCSFAYALLGRTSLLIERWKSLLTYPDYYLLPIAIALIVYDILRSKGITRRLK